MSRAAAAGPAEGQGGVDLDDGLELYRRMRLIRRFEDTVQSLFQKGDVHGTTHLYSGAGGGRGRASARCSSDGDRVAGTYRGHGHALALGVDPQALLDELLGRETGVCGGRAGSMNVVDLEHRLIGCFGIVGGSIAAATGAALALKRDGGVAVAFFGDGTTNQGYFHECLNFAQVLRCRSSTSARTTSTASSRRGEDVTAGADPRPAAGAGASPPCRSTATTSGRSARPRGRGRRARARGDGPAVRRGADLPLRRPLAQRPGRVPQARRARRLEASATR